jgi:hypothetical protein
MESCTKQDVMNRNRQCAECQLKVLNVPDAGTRKMPKCI